MRTSKPANDNRPPEFDRQLVAYLPAIRKRARALSKVGHEEIASDAVELAMRYAHTFDPKRAGFYAWLMLQVRTAARDFRVRTQRRWDRETEMNGDVAGHTPAGQIEAVMLGEILTAANDTNGRAAVLMGMGYSMKELSGMIGLCPVYANSCARAGRQVLRDMAGLGPIKRKAATGNERAAA